MVQTVPGNTWIDGGEENVAVAKTIHYTADEVKAGDYIYSDRKSTRLNSSHIEESRMPSSA